LPQNLVKVRTTYPKNVGRCNH